MEPRPERGVSAGRPAGRSRAGLSRPLRILIFGVPLALVSLLLLLALSRWWLDRFLRSEDFRQFLNRKTSAALQAEAHIEPLHWEGSEVYTAGLDVRGSHSGPLTVCNADQIRADFDLRALWRRVWRVDTINVEQMKAEVGANPIQKTAPDQPPPEQVVAPGADTNWFASWLPNRMEIGELRVSDFSLRWAANQPAAAGDLEDVHLTARMLGTVRTWDIEGHGGTLNQSNLPPVALDDFALKTTESTLFITRVSGRPKAGGKLDLSGRQALAGSRDLDLTLNLDGVPVEPLLPPDWRGRLHGSTTGNAHITGSADDPKSWRTTGHVDLREGSLEALPVLDQLALFSASARYRRAVVQKGSVDFTWTPDVLQVRNLVIESDGLLRVEGDFTVRSRQIDGLFKIGVATSSVRWVGDLGAAVFDLPSHDGYAWTTMHLTGPVDNPHEDLTGRLAASAEQAIARKAQQVPGAVIDTASGLLDLLKPH